MRRFVILSLALALVACKEEPQPFHVIPMPQEVVLSDGAFRVKGAAVKIDPALDSLSQAAVGRFVDAVQAASGRKLRSGDGGFSFELNPSLAGEQYVLDITGKGAVIQASALNGFVYACETLKQMLPPSVYGSCAGAAESSWLLPCCHISDQPRFAYRGALLDAGRYYWSTEETKRVLDVMAACKLNRFHWHLTEDQGWRVEIKAYPRLTEVGAYREGTQIGKDRESNDGVRHGGFYSREEMRDIVRYAAERGITVIPEIDLPGHMMAALAAYPQLGCTGGPYEVWTHWGVATDILCAGSEEVFEFLETVLTEVMEIFPSEYIHIGGDECFGGRRFKGEVPWDKCPRCAARMKTLGIKKGPDALSFSNALNEDNNGVNWESQLTTWYANQESACTALDNFIESGSDFLQIDFFEIADAYFKKKGLR